MIMTYDCQNNLIVQATSLIFVDKTTNHCWLYVMLNLGRLSPYLQRLDLGQNVSLKHTSLSHLRTSGIRLQITINKCSFKSNPFKWAGKHVLVKSDLLNISDQSCKIITTVHYRNTVRQGGTQPYRQRYIFVVHKRPSLLHKSLMLPLDVLP